MPDQIDINFTNPAASNGVLPTNNGVPYADITVNVNGQAGNPSVRAVILIRVPGGVMKIDGARVLPAAGGPNPPAYRFTFPSLPANMRVHLAIIAETDGPDGVHEDAILPVRAP